MRTLILIPAYNEAKCIVETVNTVISKGYDYVVINDGSTDKTLDICKEQGFNVLNLCVNLGIGGAIQAGHIYALEHGYDCDVQFDGDGQHDIDCVAHILEKIEMGEADLVVGSRFIEKTEGFQSTKMRRLGIAWLSTIIKLFSGVRVYDVTSGFRACGKQAIALFADNYPSDYPEPESIALAKKRGLTIDEVPVIMHERQGGTSSIGMLSSVYYMIKVTLAIAITGTFGKKKR